MWTRHWEIARDAHAFPNGRVATRPFGDLREIITEIEISSVGYLLEASTNFDHLRFPGDCGRYFRDTLSTFDQLRQALVSSEPCGHGGDGGRPWRCDRDLRPYAQAVLFTFALRADAVAAPALPSLLARLLIVCLRMSSPSTLIHAVNCTRAVRSTGGAHVSLPRSTGSAQGGGSGWAAVRGKSRSCPR